MMPGMRASRGIVGTALVGLLLLGAGCDDDADDRADRGDGSTSESTAGGTTDDTTDDADDGAIDPTALVQFREVTAPASTTTPTPTDCPSAPTEQPDPARATVACDAEGTSYQLGPADLVGGVDDAEAEQQQGQWVVLIALDDEAAAMFAKLTQRLVGTQGQVAVVVEGMVVSAPAITGVITDGRVQIAGDQLSESEAAELADALESH